MLSRLKATALLTTVATTLPAQSPLVTPTFPVSGIAVDFAIYFDVTLHTDVAFDLIEMNFFASPGHAGTVEVYTRPGTSVGFQRSSAGWTLVGVANAVAYGRDIPSPVDFAASAMGSVAMTPGSYGVAIKAGGGLGHRSADVVGTNNLASNLEISLTNATSLFALWGTSTLSPAALSMAFHYTVPSSWATASTVGARCVEQTSTFYEQFWGGNGPAGPQFDLVAQPGNVKALQMLWSGSGYVVPAPLENVLTPGANWITPITPDLAMGDDDLRTLALGFGFPWEGDPSGAATTDVRLSSNGFIALTNNCIGSTSQCSNAWGGMESLLGWNGVGGIGPDAKLLFFFTDLNPAGPGTVHFETSANNPAIPAGEAYVTFVGVGEWICGSCSPGVPLTMQVKLDANGNVEYRYQQGDNVNHLAWVGYTPGASLDPNGARYVRPTDISAITSPLITNPDLFGLSLAAEARPILGTTFNLQLDNVPTGSTFGLAAFSFTTQPPLALDPIAMETCFLHIGSGLGAAAFVYGFGPTAFSVTLPQDPGLAGFVLAFQGACNGGVTSSGLLASNALELILQTM